MTATTAELQQAMIDAVSDQTRLLSDWNVSNRARSWYVTSSASSVPILAANPSRRGAIIVNTDANTLWIRYGDAASTGSGGWTYQIPSGAVWEMPQPAYSGLVSGIWTAAGAGVAETTEY